MKTPARPHWVRCRAVAFHLGHRKVIQFHTPLWPPQLRLAWDNGYFNRHRNTTHPHLPPATRSATPDRLPSTQNPPSPERAGLVATDPAVPPPWIVRSDLTRPPVHLLLPPGSHAQCPLSLAVRRKRPTLASIVIGGIIWPIGLMFLAAAVLPRHPSGLGADAAVRGFVRQLSFLPAAPAAASGPTVSPLPWSRPPSPWAS